VRKAASLDICEGVYLVSSWVLPGVERSDVWGSIHNGILHIQGVKDDRAASRKLFPAAAWNADTAEL